MHLSLKKTLPHLAILVGFIIIALAYFSPVLKGDKLFQNDIKQHTGMAKQHTDFKNQTGEETYWMTNAFVGMPTYQVGARYPHNYIKKLDLTLRFLPRPADYLFVYFLGFYILLLSLKVDYKLSALGALAFGFSTYLIIILGVGHNSKALAIGYMPLVLSGIVLAFRGQLIWGFLLTTVAMGLELVANHYQMTYYLLLLVLVLGIVYLIDAYKKKLLPHYFKTVGVLCLAVILAIGLNATSIMATQDYVKESTRGESGLTINPDLSQKAETSGLDKNYITEYSYGILESFNLFIPRFMGGGSYEDVGKNSETYEAFKLLGASPIQALQETKHTPTYWGDQPIVEAPAYIGAVVLFLFVFALFLVKGRLKWWLVGGSVMALLLSYGKNLGFLTDLFIDFVPFYNKFRAVSSIQVLLELCVPALGIFGLVRLFNNFEKPERKLKALYYALSITGGLAILFLLFKSSFSFVGANDNMFKEAYGPNYIDALRDDRKAMFTSDTLRSLILVLLSGGVIFLVLKEKIKENFAILALAGLLLFDLVGVDKRYVNNDDFVNAIQVDKPYQATVIDKEIIADKSHFRVLDLASRGPAKASYFHNSVMGYHAAKPKRFNEIYDFYISKNNINVLSMLNTKYIIAPKEDGSPFKYINTEACGNAWFVKELEQLNSVNEEMLALDSLDVRNKAITSIKNLKLSNTFQVDSLASIKVTSYKPNHIAYQSNNKNDGFAVFSEAYYKNGWNAFIDDKLVPHYKVNYLLRGLPIPKGQHKIDFKFEPQVIKTGSSIALGSSILLMLLVLGGLFFNFNKTKMKQ